MFRSIITTSNNNKVTVVDLLQVEITAAILLQVLLLATENHLLLLDQMEDMVDRVPEDSVALNISKVKVNRKEITNKEDQLPSDTVNHRHSQNPFLLLQVMVETYLLSLKSNLKSHRRLVIKAETTEVTAPEVTDNNHHQQPLRFRHLHLICLNLQVVATVTVNSSRFQFNDLIFHLAGTMLDRHHHNNPFVIQMETMANNSRLPHKFLNRMLEIMAVNRHSSPATVVLNLFRLLPAVTADRVSKDMVASSSHQQFHSQTIMVDNHHDLLVLLDTVVVDPASNNNKDPQDMAASNNSQQLKSKGLSNQVAITVDHHHLVLLLFRLAEVTDTLAVVDPAVNKDTTVGQHNNSRITVVLLNGRVFHPEAEDLPPSNSNVLNLVVDTMAHPFRDLKVKEDMEVRHALLPQHHALHR